MPDHAALVLPGEHAALGPSGTGEAEVGAVRRRFVARLHWGQPDHKAMMPSSDDFSNRLLGMGAPDMIATLHATER
jgi:hypothetical protein